MEAVRSENSRGSIAFGGHRRWKPFARRTAKAQAQFHFTSPISPPLQLWGPAQKPEPAASRAQKPGAIQHKSWMVPTPRTHPHQLLGPAQKPDPAASLAQKPGAIQHKSWMVPTPKKNFISPPQFRLPFSCGLRHKSRNPQRVGHKSPAPSSIKAGWFPPPAPIPISCWVRHKSQTQQRVWHKSQAPSSTKAGWFPPQKTTTTTTTATPTKLKHGTPQLGIT